MAADYRTIRTGGHSEVVEKKSRFLGECLHCETLEEAEACIASVRKKHYDARHHCFAYVVGEPGTPEEIIRSSDDGEPSGTAGKPLLEILTGRGLHKTLLLVTRYFGGTLLGTGGLVRAYSQAGREAAEAAESVQICRGTLLCITCSYPAYGKLQYLFAKEGLTIRETAFGEEVVLTVIAPVGEEERIRKLVAEITDGAAGVEETGPVEYEKPFSTAPQ